MPWYRLRDVPDESMTVRRVASNLGTFLLLLMCACWKGDTSRIEPPNPLVGTWVRVYLWTDLRDTLRLFQDGTASGKISGTAGTILPTGAIERWQVGHRMMPGGFCLAARDEIQCQGFLLKDDTLALATPSPIVLVRVDSMAPGQSPQMPSRPAPGWVPFEVRAPRLGDTVHGSVPQAGR